MIRSLQRRSTWPVVVLVLLLFAVSCSDDDSATDTAETGDSADDAGRGDNAGDDSNDAAPDEPADEPTEESDDMRDLLDADADAADLDSSAQDDSAQEESPYDGGSGLAVPPEITPIVIGRQIIFTAEIDIRVQDVADATRAATEAIVSVGGLVFGQDTTTDPQPRTVLTFKVLPEDFDDAIAALEGIGQVERQTVSTDDVTERVVDLESRITTAEASVERIRVLLDGAGDLGSIRELEQQLLERETVLEQLKGQLKTVRDQVALATITLTLTQKSASDIEAEIDVVAWLGVDEDEACPGVSELTMEADEEAVLCIEVRNTGDDALTAIDIQVPTFRLRVDDLTLRSGELATIEPGEAITAVVALQADDGFIRRIDVSDGVNIDIITTGIPAGDDEVELQAVDRLFLAADVDEQLPGFGDSFGAGLGALALIGSILLIGVGVLLPFSLFLALLGWFVFRSNRKRREDATTVDTEPNEPTGAA